MARLIKMQAESILHAVLQTIFEDDSVTERSIALGDIVQDLRYVKDGELITVSGKVIGITYSLPSKITFNRTNPKNTFSTDVTLSSIKMDCSTEYESNVVEIPVKEIVEDEGVENVKRMKYYAELEYKIKMYYSNRTTTTASLKVGDKLDGVRIMTNTPGIDITGEFEIVAFAYVRNSSTAFTVTGIVIKNEQYGTIIADLDKILALTELMTYETSSLEQVTAAITDARDGETIKLNGNIDATSQTIDINGKNITIDLGGSTVIASSSIESGLSVSNGGVLNINGDGIIETNTPYDTNHGAAVINVKDGGTLNYNGGTINAVLDNPVEQGQFGIKAIGTSTVNINGGNINTGWYGVSTHGTQTNSDTVININGGKFNSVSDYAVYIPKGNLIVNDGEITGAAGAVSCNGGSITINGGIFKCSGGGDTGDWVDGTSGMSNAAINLNGKYSAVTCNIHGGKFISLDADPIIIAGTTHPVNITIDGGLFSQIPAAEYIADGYMVTEEPNAEGFYEVIPA